MMLENDTASKDVEGGAAAPGVHVVAAEPHAGQSESKIGQNPPVTDPSQWS
jgi:hypothetical protein